MKFNPDKYHRRSIRLKDYDYSQPGGYFVTVCTKNRECMFGEIIDGAMDLNDLGEIVQKCWKDLPDHFPHIELDTFTIMPSHVHGIIMLHNNVGAQLIAPESTIQGMINHAPTLGQIIRTFKATTTRFIRRDISTRFNWQRNYYEHVIRNEKSLAEIREYITNNPFRSEDDEENPDNIST